MAVRIRMTKLGRRHRPFFRLCAVDGRAARDGKVIEYLGHYDPMISETDARAVLNKERIDYWLSVGAQPSDKVAVLIKKYGSQGTHLEQQQAAIERLKLAKPTAPPAKPIPKKSTEEEAAASESSGEEATAEAENAAEAKAEEAQAEESTADAQTEEAKAEDQTKKEETPPAADPS